MITTRGAAISDLAAVAQVHYRGWEVEHRCLDPVRRRANNKVYNLTAIIQRQAEIIASQHNPEDSFFQVAFDDQQLVGFLQAKMVRGAADLVQVRRWYVIPEYQRRGVGWRLVGDLLPWLKNGQQLQITVAAYNQSMIDFYRQYRFVITGRVDQPLPAIKMSAIVDYDWRQKILA